MEKSVSYYGDILLEPRTIHDVLLVRKYGEHLIKLHQLNCYPNPKASDVYRETILINGFEFFIDEIAIMPNGEITLLKDYKRKCTVNDVKLLNNLTRAKSKILEYSLCNDWQFFATFTIDRKKFNRYELNNYHTKFTQWLRNYNKKFDCNIKYLFVPERHKDGAWHEHGFIMGLPESHLSPFTLSQRLPHYIRDKLKDGHKVYNWEAYQHKFGFCDFEPIKSHEKASYYILKYITKDLQKSVSKLGNHLYYNSKGLNLSELVAKGEFCGRLVFDYENDFCKCNTLAYSDDLLSYIKSKIDDKGYFT